MPARVTWRNLLPGLIALTVVLLIAVAVLVFAGVGRIHGEKIRLFVVTNQARGVMRGTEVWLAGQKIGVVDDIRFRAPSTDTSARVLLVLSVRKSDAAQIRLDSRAQVRAGANIIGPIVVYLSAGTPQAARAQDGDTLRGAAQGDLEVAAVKLKAATQELGPLMTDARVVLRRVRDPNGSVGAFLAGGFTRRSDVAELRANVSRVRAALVGGEGSGEVARSRAAVVARARAALARVDSIRALLASPRGSIGRFRRDSTLASSVARVRDDLDALRATLDSADGTLARLAGDSALARAMIDARREMSTLFDDIRRRPLHYIYF